MSCAVCQPRFPRPVQRAGKAGAAVHARTSVRKPSRCPGGGLACSGVQRMHLCVCVREERFQASPRCYERTAGRFERHERHRGAMVAPRSVSEARKRFKTRVFGRVRSCLRALGASAMSDSGPPPWLDGLRRMLSPPGPTTTAVGAVEPATAAVAPSRVAARPLSSLDPLPPLTQPPSVLVPSTGDARATTTRAHGACRGHHAAPHTAGAAVARGHITQPGPRVSQRA